MVSVPLTRARGPQAGDVGLRQKILAPESTKRSISPPPANNPVVAEASSRPGSGAAVTGPDLEPAVVPTAGSVVQVLAAADRSKAFTASPSPPAGLVAGA